MPLSAGAAVYTSTPNKDSELYSRGRGRLRWPFLKWSCQAIELVMLGWHHVRPAFHVLAQCIAMSVDNTG
jgi:hypothetical protein